MNSEERYQRLKQEVFRLFEFVQQIKQQIASVKHPKSQIDPFGTVAEQLKAIVKSTEDASETIMSSTESILSEVVPLSSAIRFSEAQERFATINDSCNAIFEACAFQDLTGQRISKIGRTMTKIEQTLNDIVKLVGGPDGVAELPPPAEELRVRDGVVLDGPQLEGEGVSQGDIDKLFQPEAAPAPAPASPPQQKDAAVKAAPKAAAAPPKPQPAKPAAAPAAKAAPAPAAKPAAPQSNNQADIDKMFDVPAAKPQPAKAAPVPAAKPAAPQSNNQADVDKLFDAPAPKPAAPPAAPAKPQADTAAPPDGATVSQADIDKLFG